MVPADCKKAMSFTEGKRILEDTHFLGNSVDCLHSWSVVQCGVG